MSADFIPHRCEKVADSSDEEDEEDEKARIMKNKKVNYFFPSFYARSLRTSEKERRVSVLRYL